MGKKQKRKNQPTAGRSHDIDALFETAYGFHVKGNEARAEELYQRIIRMEPRHSNALNLLGTICLERGEYDKALVLIKKAIQAYPMGAMFHNNLGNVFREMGLKKDAEKAYREALRVDPDCVTASNNLGTVLHEQGNMEGAVVFFEKACRKDPGFSPAYYNLGRVFCEQGRIVTAIWAYKEALKINPDFKDAYSNYLYSLHFSDTETPERVFAEHVAWAEAFAQKHYPVNPVFDLVKDRGKRLRVGYVSPDFRTHSVAFFLEDVMAAHDRTSLEVFCYSLTSKKDGFTQRFRELADTWRDISNVSDDEACRMIREDSIDILVDLAGHTGNSRLLIFARKPAPIQVTWLGYPDTTGLATMDYRITDAIADPPGEADRFATEKLVRLKGGFHCYRPSGESCVISALPCRKTGAVTFGSFNNNSKISESVIAAWARILKQIPDSRLKLKSRSFADFGTRKFILERFDDHGIPAERIWFEGYKVTLREHFLLYNTVDIALDTFPYNGTTTTCEALWMGVPVIALNGNTHASRVGASLLHHAGLDDCLARTVDEYVEKAVALSRDFNRLDAYRTGLRQAMARSPLMDSKAFAAKLELAFREMWETWVEQEASDGMDIKNKGFSKDIYEKNLLTLRNFHPHIEPLLDEPPPFGVQVRFSKENAANIFIEAVNGNVTPVYPEHQPVPDLSSLRENLTAMKGKVICVMGGGLFQHAKAILDMAGDRNLVVFFEAFPVLLKAALSITDLTAVLAHPHARFAVGQSPGPYELIHSEEDRLYTHSGGEFIEYGPLVSLDPNWYADRKKSFGQFLTRRKISKKTVAFAGRRFLTNSFENLLGLSESRPLNALENVMAGVPAVVVAAGPSLTKNIGDLVSAKDKVWIIAVDSAVAPLMARGITPHAVVSVDYNAFTFEKLASHADRLADADLICIPTVTSMIMNGIRFRNRYFSFPDKGFRNLFNRMLRCRGEALEDVHSVTHLAMAAALVAGCEPIILTGLDLAFSGKADHAEGTVLHWNGNHAKAGNTLMVEGVDGSMVESTAGFIAAQEICERLIEKAEGRTFIDATEGGAKIAGTRIATLEETLAAWCHHPVDVQNRLGGRFQTIGSRAVIDELDSVITDCKQLLERLEQYERERRTVERHVAGLKNRTLDPGSLPPAITTAAGAMDTINRTLDQDSLLNSLSSIFSEFYDEYMEVEMDVVQESVSPGRRFIAALKQQAFVQDVRKKALDFLIELASKARDFTDNAEMCLMPGLLPLDRLSYGLDMFIQQGYLVTVWELAERIAPHPGSDYYKGCIQMMKGRISDGEWFFAKALEQDGSWTSRISSFKETLIDTWLNSKGLDSYRRICLARALEIEPTNQRAISLNREWFSQRIMTWVASGDFDSAFSELRESTVWIDLDDGTLSAVYALLLLSRDYTLEGLEYLQVSIEKAWACPGRDELFSGYFFRIFGVASFLPGALWVMELIREAGQQRWAKRALQELFCLNLGVVHGKIIKRIISEIEVAEVENRLEVWRDIRSFVPEWAVFKACVFLYRGAYDDAEALIQEAIGMDIKPLPFIGGQVGLPYILAMFILYRGDKARGEAMIEKILSSADGLIYSFRVTIGLFFVWIERGRDAIELFGALLNDRENPLWVNRICSSFIGDNSIMDSREYRSLAFLSWYYFAIGKHCLEAGDLILGSDCLRAAVNHDPSILLKKDGGWIKNQILTRWRGDCSAIESFLAEGEVKKAEALCQEWEASRAALDDYHPVRAIILEKKDGVEGALGYLESLPMGEADDPHVLFYFSKLLFLSGRRDRAVLSLSRAVAIDSGAAELWEDMGDVWFEEGDYDQAMGAYERCITALPDRVDAMRKIGDVYRMTGKTDAAVMAYRIVLRADRGNAAALESLKAMEEGGAMP